MDSDDYWYADSYNFKRLRRFLEVDEPNESGWWDAHCPLHDDRTRSAGFNFDEDMWSCRAGCGSGSITELVSRLNAEEAAQGDDGDDDVIDLNAERKARRKPRQAHPVPTEEDVQRWVDALASDAELTDALATQRGIPPEVLKEYEVGWCDERSRFAIPIRNSDGELINVRLYHWRGRTKIISWGDPSFDPNALFPENVLDANESVILCEGEWDAVLLNGRGFPAVTGTTGAKQWQKKWNRKFAGKDVTLLYDRDKTGDQAVEIVTSNLHDVARSVRVATLPLPWSEKHGQDVTDFFNTAGGTDESLRKLLADASVAVAPKDSAPVKVSVQESYNPELAGRPMEITANIVGRSVQVHLIPKEVATTCDVSAGKTCHGCPMADNDGSMMTVVKPSDPVVLKLRDVNETKRDEVIREFIGAHKCGRMDTMVVEAQTTELLMIRTSLDEEAADADHRSRSVVNVGPYKTEANSTMRLVGTSLPDPSSQESVFLSWQMNDVESALDNYTMSREEAQMLRQFRPNRQTPLNKCVEIADDLASITGIIGRTSLHVAMDLVWHSALSFNFAGESVDRGWLELLVVGDTRTGKSEVATKLSKHYGFGRLISCEAASIPGLLGAVKPMGGNKGWVLEWGAIPLNDRRLVVLDEVGGLTHEQIGQMSSMRSTGVAEIIKAEREQTHARTRLIWLGNPRDNHYGMASYTWGIQAIAPLIGSQEDIARFDIAMTVSNQDVPLSDINRRRAGHRTSYTPEACHALVRWAWSRQRDQILWGEGAEDIVFKEAERLGKFYVPDPPLVQGQNVRIKIARLAVAIAMRTFSTDRTYENVMVLPAHVKSAVKFMERLYGDDGFGYKEVSERERRDEREAIERLDEVKEYLYSRKGLAQFLLASKGRFRRQQMEEMMNISREEANMIIKRLAGMRMIQANSDWDYKIMPLFNIVLREAK